MNALPLDAVPMDVLPASALLVKGLVFAACAFFFGRAVPSATLKDAFLCGYYALVKAWDRKWHAIAAAHSTT